MLFIYFILICNCCYVLAAYNEDTEECQIHSVADDGALALVASTPNKLEEFLIRLGLNFKRFVFVVEIKNSLTFQPSYKLDSTLEVKGENIFNENNYNESAWQPLIVKLFNKPRLTRDTIVLRVFFNNKAYDLDTLLWWRQYKAVKVHILAEGKVDLTFGCIPSDEIEVSEDVRNATGTYLKDRQESYSILILLIILGIILSLIFVISIFLTILYFRKMKKRLLLQQQYESHLYESLEENFMNKERMEIPLSLLPPPLPAPRYTFNHISNYESGVEEKQMISCDGRPTMPTMMANSRCISVSSSGSNAASNILYNYDFPPLKGGGSSTDQNGKTEEVKEEENQYLDMSSNPELDKINSKD